MGVRWIAGGLGRGVVDGLDVFTTERPPSVPKLYAPSSRTKSERLRNEVIDEPGST